MGVVRMYRCGVVRRYIDILITLLYPYNNLLLLLGLFLQQHPYFFVHFCSNYFIIRLTFWSQRLAGRIYLGEMFLMDY